MNLPGCKLIIATPKEKNKTNEHPVRDKGLYIFFVTINIININSIIGINGL